ncbi:hypothetical protein JOC77_000541 [Peribacillus deserti]|uniref:Uncharacterized protein n=1 Tax=Peribacillus deserti TaxID=673318 RepID=A0ABS2QFQ6_9BACI|nr:hypothetical protein [Peribacillus deserti]
MALYSFYSLIEKAEDGVYLLLFLIWKIALQMVELLKRQ